MPFYFYELIYSATITSLFLISYLEVITSVKPGKKDQIIAAELTELEKTNPTGEEELSLLTDWYGRIGDDEKAELFKKILLEKYPKCKIAEEEKVAEFRNESSIDKKIEIAKEFEQQFPQSENVEYLYDLTANTYRDNKQYVEVLNFLKKNVSKTSTYRFYSVVNRMLDENADLVIALTISELGVERTRRELENPSKEKPGYLSESEWLKDREYYLGLNLYGKGRVLYDMDKRKEAQFVLQESVQLTKKKDELINELYAKSLIENGEYSTAMSEISGFIKSGYSTAQMKSFLKEAYLNEKGTDDGFETYASQFEDAANEKLIQKLKNEMILDPAPQFSLLDLEGNKVSLQDYKGKTIIIDFWATWCGPCLSSFPGMKQAIRKYADNDKVKFLFVNSWERVEDKRKNAIDFISKNDYPFHVLLDDENIVIGKYMVSGIPTKFVIDSEGNIRFKNIGFSGSDDKLVEEISTMISLVN